jgi:aryl-phospho-beta-D-glucosidase BglC (GH1 family)
VNLSGAEWQSGEHWPTASELDYYHQKGLNTIRLPIEWTRFQSSPGAPMNQVEMGKLDQVLRNAKNARMHVIVDLHDYDRYQGNVVTKPSELANFWGQMAQAVQKSPNGSAVAGYDLMNEPHDDGGVWATNAQAAINAIRATGDRRAVFVEGESWAGAHDWPQNNANLAKLKDPANNLIFEAHSYWDSDHSGTYAPGKTPDPTASTGVQDLQPFVEWCKKNGVRGFVGELGVPSHDPKWFPAENNALQYLKQNGIGWTAWSGGQYWGNSPGSILSIDHSPELQVLQKAAGLAQDEGSPAASMSSL